MTQLTWLQSVKEAIEVRKQQETETSAKQRDNFWKFFVIKKPNAIPLSGTPPPTPQSQGQKQRPRLQLTPELSNPTTTASSLKKPFTCKWIATTSQATPYI
jgi:hypothetical protein